MQLPTSVQWFKRLTLSVALTIGLAPPLVFFLLQYRSEQAWTRVEAQVSASTVVALIHKNPDLWMFEQVRLEELLAQRPFQDQSREIRYLYAPNQELIASRDDGQVRPPLITSEAPVFNGGQVVATLQVSRSLWHIIMSTLVLAAVSLLSGVAVYLAVNAVPLRALRLAIGSLRDEKDKASTTLQAIGDAVITTDIGARIENLNPAAEKLLGWTVEEARGRPVHEVVSLLHEQTREPLTSPVRECLETNETVLQDAGRHAVLLRKTDGAEVHVDYSAAPIRGDGGAVFSAILGSVLVLHDVSERRTAQQKLRHIAYHDALTGLPNRAQFQLSLARAIEEAGLVQQSVAVMFLDLDRFKIINDSLGHDIGDKLLVQVAKRLKKAVRAQDLVARLGGDEFTVILENVTDLQHVVAVANKLIAAVAQPFDIDNQNLSVTTSIGIATFPQDGSDVDDILKKSDAAMYQAKDFGRNTYKFFASGYSQHSVEKLKFDNALYSALESGEFYLEYQPKLHLKTDRVVGVEALIRWNSPIFGRVSPDRFIQALEVSGLIIPVGAWVMRTAIAQLAQWIAAGNDLKMSINVSARQLMQSPLLEVMGKALAEFSVPASSIVIEVTESLLIGDFANSERRLLELRAMGMQISLDDFGSGYSSLGYLQRFPIDELKMDKSFVDHIATNQTAGNIVRTVIDLGHVLGMQVVAEGVESQAQLEILRTAGCDVIQGYWLSRPIPVSEVEGWVRSR